MLIYTLYSVSKHAGLGLETKSVKELLSKRRDSLSDTIDTTILTNASTTYLDKL
uniref:Uncharacterized protein n=1 Tax=uncultured Chloroflexi bacterium HF0500_03M05 TaxID=710737 RepID=E0XY72_9CHLR|nr:hypothetical protein [uncultured Chloroflexi bacterium HF0500_03M05]